MNQVINRALRRLQVSYETFQEREAARQKRILSTPLNSDGDTVSRERAMSEFDRSTLLSSVKDEQQALMFFAQHNVEVSKRADVVHINSDGEVYFLGGAR